MSIMNQGERKGTAHLNMTYISGLHYLAKDTKDEKPEGGGHPCHAGRAQREGDDAVVLSKHIHWR